MRSRLSPAQQSAVERMAAQGIGPSVIACELGLKPSQIENTRRKLIRAGLAPRRPRPPHKAWSTKETDKLISLIEQGVHYATIAKRMKRTEVSIRLRCKRIGVLLTTTNATMSARDVAAHLGVRCSKTISNWIRRGWLKATNANDRGRTLWRITWEDLTTFLENAAYWVAWRPDRIPDLALREWAQELRANEEPLLGHAEIAARFGVGRDTIGNWLDKGWLPSTRYGNRRIPQSALDDWIVPIERAVPMNQEWPNVPPSVVGRVGSVTFYRYTT